MNGRRWLVATATAVALVCLPAAARADVDGNELWRLCTSKGTRANGLCYGYVTAIAESRESPTASMATTLACPNTPRGAKQWRL